MSTILVTGGAGYIGSHFVLAAKDAGLRPVVLDDLSTGFREALDPDTPFAEGRAGDAALVRQLVVSHDIEEVVHFAGSLSVPESVRDPEKYYRNNTAETEALARACVEAGVRRMVYSSTCAVYGNPQNSPVSEAETPTPINPYGRSKLLAEGGLAELAAAHPPFSFVALRYFNVAGADPDGRAGPRDPRAQQLVSRAVDAALGHGPALEVFGTDYPTRDGTGERDYIHVTDLVEAHLAALAYLRAGGTEQRLNLGYGRGVTVREIVARVEAVGGLKVPVREVGRRAGDAASVVADPARFMAATGWRPRLDSLDAIVASNLAWRRRLLATR